MHNTNILWGKINTFLNSPFAEGIINNPNWTITLPQVKMPIDSYALMHKGKIWGAAFDRGYNPLITLPQLLQWFQSQSKDGHFICPSNLCYYLQAEHDRHIVLDIEPACPREALNNFLDTLPYSYAETSLSGKGVHLGFILPENHQINFQNLSVIKQEKKHYEFLMNNKFCTFTMNQILPQRDEREEKALLSLLMPMYETWKEHQTVRAQFIMGMDKPAIPEEEYMMRMSGSMNLKQTLEDCGCDYSRYEFKYAVAILFRLKALMRTSKLKDIQYTPEQAAWLVYQILKEKLEHRSKHNELREGVPWLLYIAKDSVQKMWNKPFVQIKKGAERK